MARIDNYDPSKFDFFEQQEIARRNTRWLVLWYAVAVLAVIASYCIAGVLLYALFALFGWLPLSGSAPLEWRGLFATYVAALLRVPMQATLAMAGAVACIILVVSARRAWQLNLGGTAVAQLLGARYVESSKCDAAERRLLNVVEEMSIASGISVPPVYIIEDIETVNALVGGYSPNEAAIVVTRGAVQKLSRDELQGVMGHEYSHILNGDMALNMRIACILAGLSWLGQRGEQMAYRAVASAPIADGLGVLVGGLVAFIGFPGTVVADSIKAAVSRQRELLADSASVQYTRNPDGIAGALDSILALRAQTGVLAVHANEFTHMFFAPAVVRWWDFPTHPPIEDRILHAHPRFQRDTYRASRHGTRLEVAVLDDSGGEVVNYMRLNAAAMAAQVRPVAGGLSAQHIDYAAQLLGRLPQRLREALRRADEAECAMFALALCPDITASPEALAVLEARRGAQCVARTAALYLDIGGLARHHMLTLATLAVQAIKAQAQQERDRFLGDLGSLIEADRAVTMAEFVLHTLLTQRLRDSAGQPVRVRFSRVAELSEDARLILSLVAFAAEEDTQRAYEKGAAVLELGARIPLGPEALDTNRIRDALERLRQLAPAAKSLVLQACFEAAASDGVFRLAETELVRMVAATLDCPVPPLLEAHDPESGGHAL